MATEQVGESRDVGPLLQGERQVLEMIATGAPLPAAVLDGLPCLIDSRSGFTPAVLLVDGGETRLARADEVASSRRVASRHGPFPLAPTRRPVVPP